MKTKLLFLPLLILLMYCQPEKEVAVKLKVDLESGEEELPQINLYNLSEQVGGELLNPISSYEADTSGSYIIELDSIDFGLYAIEAGGKSIPVILFEGVDMEVTCDLSDLKTLSYTGEGADESEFYNKFNPFPSSQIQAYGQLEPEEFVAKIDSTFQESMNEINANDSLNSLVAGMEEALLKLRRGFFVKYYPISRKRSAGGEANVDLPESVEAYTSIDGSLAKVGLIMPDYRNAIYNNNQLGFNEYMQAYQEENPDTEMGINKYIELRKDFILEEEDANLHDFLMARLSLDAISYYGEEATEIVFGSYKGKFPDSRYKPYLDAVNAKWEALAEGKPAKEVEGTAPDGSEIKLSDFKGKVVYLDTWATWCGPCRGEFPSAKVLKEEYKDNEDVVFMYASIDSNKDAWEKYLQNDPEFKGVHVYVDGAWKSELCEDYMIKAIPRYILFDKEGKIANAKAPRPSSGDEIREAINTLL
ncbi:TlpA family protein disulfide reductase [Echinicola sp. CAU 1574]|uniref:TlpA family protein disulfide reductase n=1 Tax=Echinicola arenosa TaxID=2774144 RepID=A0ABR9AL16_9BACT|nr:TlpA disulfide reductase family protein [Echinicola arenosa]MBD8488523.1 TlpA family protein disulfide reductase [Echinicola arenosa]